MHLCITRPQWVNTNLICLQTCHDQCSMGLSLFPGSCMTKQLIVAEKCQVVTSTGLISGVCVMFQWRLRQADVLTLHWNGSSVIWRKFRSVGAQKVVKTKMMRFHFSANGINCFEGHQAIYIFSMIYQHQWDAQTAEIIPVYPIYLA